METLLIIFACAVSPFLSAFAMIQILKRLRRSKRDVPPVKAPDAAGQKRDRD